MKHFALGVFFLFLLWVGLSKLSNQIFSPYTPTPDWSSQGNVVSSLEDYKDQTGPSSSPLLTTKKPIFGKNSSAFVAYNLQNYLEQPPSRTSKETNYKSEKAIQGIINTLQKTSPSILGVCEIGTQLDLLDLQQRLKKRGIDLPYSYLSESDDPLRHLALISRFPITPHPYTPPSYSIQGVERIIRRGILDATVHLPGQSIRFLGIHLKSKRPSPYFDHNKIRRYEAQTVRDHASSILKDTPETPLIVYGDLNDSKQSPSFKALQGNYKKESYLKALSLEASNGSRWTHFWSHEDNYSRIDYIWASKHAAPLCIVENPSLLPLNIENSGSDHRALKVMLRHH